MALACVLAARLVGQRDPPSPTRGSAGGSRRTAEVDGIRDSSSMHPQVDASIPGQKTFPQVRKVQLPRLPSTLSPRVTVRN